MRINQHLASFVLLHALVACAGEGTDVDPASLTLHATEKKPWSMRISVPVGSDFFIKTFNDTGVLDDVKANPDDPTAFGNTAKRIPKKKKIKTKYHVVAQMDWTASGADDTTIGGRGFWVGKGGDTSVPVNELEKVGISIFVNIDTDFTPVYRSTQRLADGRHYTMAWSRLLIRRTQERVRYPQRGLA